MTARIHHFFAPVAALLITLSISAQEEQTDPMLARFAVQMTSAKHDFNIGNLRGALTGFREVLDEVPGAARVELWIARCHLGLRREDLAIAYLDSVMAHDVDLAQTELKLRGEILHRLARYEEAIDVLEQYLDFGKPDAIDEAQARHWITECRRAWAATDDLAAHPSDLRFEHMGGAINSRFDEYAPAWSPDGQAIAFTSRRDGGLNPEIDESGDHQFYSDIYISRKSSSEPGGWTRASLLPGAINTMGFDAILSWPVAAGGGEILVYRNNNFLAGDICKSTRAEDGSWTDAEPIERPVNSSYFEGSASISADGEFLYFISERPEGLGHGDIFRSTKKSFGWSTPEPLGAPVNTAEDEKFVHAHGDGRVIFFASKGHAGFGDYDMYRTEWVHEGWSIPVNLGMPLNGPREESTFALSADGRQLAITAERPEGFGARDIYSMDVTDHPWMGVRAGEVWAGGLEVTADLSSLPKIKGDKVRIEIWDADARSVRHVEPADRNGRAFFRAPANTDFVIRVLGPKGNVLCEQSWSHEQSAPGEFMDKLTCECKE